MDSPVTSRAALLEVLRVPGYGLDLAQRLRQRTGGRVVLGPGSLYPALRALERQSLVRSRPQGARVASGRPGRYYELTPAGVRAAQSQAELLASLFHRAPAERPSADEVDRIRGRIARCARASDFARHLRRAVSDARRAGPAHGRR